MAINRLNRWAFYRCLLLLPPLAAGAAHIAGYAGYTLPWIADLLTHWLFPCAIVALGLACFERSAHRRIAALSAVLCLVQIGIAFLPPTVNKQPTRPTFTIKLATANVLSSNSNHTAFKAWLAQSSPELVAVLEVSPAWAGTLESLPGYPHKKIIPRDDNFGIALLSKYPLSDIALPTLLAEGNYPPSIAVKVHRTHDTELLVIATHPVPPVLPAWHSLRNEQLDQLARFAAAYPSAAVIMGDLNATPWSDGFRVVERAGMYRLSTLRPTWPARGLPYELIPIDHVLGNARAGASDSSLGPDIGSDHRPVEATILLFPNQE